MLLGWGALGYAVGETPSERHSGSLLAGTSRVVEPCAGKRWGLEVGQQPP
ncbi:Hypothetical protein AA314_08039 [Archangium gephyra]|uniref:Uncharacterized protein n=1 Tax=Archangium gephyra TaxID=48 RepID=A0AAC8QFG9_9BACT|nr:Hypothetical protein AA314_08039 [Archangium gephyra]